MTPFASSDILIETNMLNISTPPPLLWPKKDTGKVKNPGVVSAIILRLFWK